MAFVDIVDAIFNPVFGWLLNIPPILAILILSLLLGLFSTVLQKYLTNQAKMRRIKNDTKKMQKQMREHQKKGETDKVLKVQQQLMPIQMDMMKESFRPLLVTMVPFLLIFFWLSNHFAFYPVQPGESFPVSAEFGSGASGEVTLSVPESFTLDEATKQVVDGEAAWMVSGPEGKHAIQLSYAGATFSRNVLITEARSYEPPVEQFDGPVQSITIGNKKLLPLGDGFNLFGWKPGWIFYYILFSIPISLGFKKLLNVV